MKDVQVDAHVRLAALLDQCQGGVETGAERALAAKLQAKRHAIARSPLRGLSERDDGALQVGRINLVHEVGDHQQRFDAELLTNIEPAAKLVEVGFAGVGLRQEQAPLIGRGGQRQAAIGKQLAGVGGGVGREMIFELGQPDFHGIGTRIGVIADILREIAGHRRRLTETRFHAGEW